MARVCLSEPQCVDAGIKVLPGQAGQEAFRVESQTYTEPNVNSKCLSDSSMTLLTFPCSGFQSCRGTVELQGLASSRLDVLVGGCEDMC